MTHNNEWDRATCPVLASPPAWEPPGFGAATVAPGVPPYQPMREAYRTTTNRLAVASLVLGLVWLGGLASVPALIFGHRAKRAIARSGGTQRGRGMATAGIVLGWIGTVFLAISLLSALPFVTKMLTNR